MTEVKALAFAIIKQLNFEVAGVSTEQEKSEVHEEMHNLKVLLAFLWVSEQGLLPYLQSCFLTWKKALITSIISANRFSRKFARRRPLKLDHL